MSKKVIESYMKRMTQNDPMRDLFVKVVLPSLTKLKSQSYLCALCGKDRNKQKKVPSFANYYTYIRHLGENHRNQLPCEGDIFNSLAINHRCKICDKDFKRKEHFQAHLSSKSHKEKVKISNSTGNNY